MASTAGWFDRYVDACPIRGGSSSSRHMSWFPIGSGGNQSRSCLVVRGFPFSLVKAFSA